MKVVISLLIHEQEEVVFDQIRNFEHYVPEVQILLHIAGQWRRRSPAIVDRFNAESRVMVNPESVETAWADGSQAEAHISNIRFIIDSGIEVDGCLFHASNDLYVRTGVLEYLKGRDAACGQKDILNDPDWSPHVKKDRAFQFLAAKLGVTPVWSEIEGSYYSIRVLKELVNVLDDYPTIILEKILRRLPASLRLRGKFRNTFKGVFYPREETLFPTLASPFIEKRVEPICLRKLDASIPVATADVESMRKGQFDSTLNVPRKFFVLKRINRSINDSVRSYIRNSIESKIRS
jgi:hypothetical protein